MNELIYSIAKTTSWLIADEEEKIIQNFIKGAGYRPNEIVDFIYAGYKITEYLIPHIEDTMIYRITLYRDFIEITHKDIEINIKVD